MTNYLLALSQLVPRRTMAGDRRTTTVTIKTKQTFMHTQKRLQLRRTVANVNNFVYIIRHFNETHVARSAILPRRLQRTSLLHVVFIRCWRCCAFQSK